VGEGTDSGAASMGRQLHSTMGPACCSFGREEMVVVPWWPDILKREAEAAQGNADGPMSRGEKMRCGGEFTRQMRSIIF